MGIKPSARVQILQFKEARKAGAQVKYPLSEVFDRLTIETRKRHYGANNDKLLAQYLSAVEEKLNFRDAGLMMALIELAVANCDVANLEWAIRTNKELSNEEVGRRALAIRDINARRIAAKTQIARLVGEFVDPSRYDQRQKFTSILQLPEKTHAAPPRRRQKNRS